MTEKRFTYEYSHYDSTGEILDWIGNRVLITDYLQKWELKEWCDELNKIVDENNQLRKENEQLKYDRDNCRKQQIRQANKIHELFDENKQLKSDNNRLVNETAKIVAEHQGRVLDLIDEKIKLYSHKPVSAPISQPMSVNFDKDMDRLARLSELEALKEELTE